MGTTEATIKDFVQQVKHQFTDGNDIIYHLSNLNSVVSDFTEIKAWLSRLDEFKVETVLPTIYKCLQFGHYSSNITRYFLFLDI